MDETLYEYALAKQLDPNQPLIIESAYGQFELEGEAGKKAINAIRKIVEEELTKGECNA